MSRGRRMRVSIALLFLCVEFLSPAAAQADPSGATCEGLPTLHNTFVYQTVAAQSSFPVTSVRAYISEYSPYYTGYNDAGTSESIVLVSQGSSLEWAQLGWIKWDDPVWTGGGAKREVFAETVSSTTGNTWMAWPAKAIGSDTQYQIRYSASKQSYSYLVNGVVYASVGAGFVPTEIDVEAETHDQADQSPGGTNRWTVIADVQYTSTFDWSNWMDFTSPMSSSAPWAGVMRSGNTYYIWDTRCSE